MKILKKKKYLILIILICICLRLLLFFVYKPWQENVEKTDVLIFDAQDFHNLSVEIINNKRFYNISNNMIETLRTPGYPLFLSIIYKIFGYRPWIVLLFHIIIESLSCLFLYKAMKRLFKLKVALYTALFYALNPFLILYSMTLISEILLIFFIILSFYFFTYLTKERSKKTIANLIISAFLIGITALIKPIAQYLPIIYFLYILIYFREKIKTAIIYSFIYIIIFLLTISPWIIRNYGKFKVISLSSSGNYNLLELYATPLITQKYKIEKGEAKDSLYNEVNILIEKEGNTGENLNQFQISNYYKRVALLKIKENPILFSKIFLMGIFHTYSSTGVKRYSMMLNLSRPDNFDIKEYSNIVELIKGFINKWGSSSVPILSFTMPYLLVIYLLAITGIFAAYKYYIKKYIFLIIVISLYFIFIAGPAGLVRFKLPAIPFYLPLSSIGLIFIIEKTKRKKQQANKNLKE